MATVYDFLNPDGSEVEEQRIIRAPGATTGDVLTVAANGTVSPAAGGGGSQSGAERWRGPFEFAFDDAGLAAGIEFYTPTIGDWLLDAVIVAGAPVGTGLPWDGTTPLGDFGYVAETGGFFGDRVGAVDMTKAPGALFGGRVYRMTNSNESLNRLFTNCLQSTGGLPNLEPPWFFITDDPLAVWVTQDGAPGGADPGAAQGAGAIWLQVATPDVF